MEKKDLQKLTTQSDVVLRARRGKRVLQAMVDEAANQASQAIAPREPEVIVETSNFAREFSQFAREFSQFAREFSQFAREGGETALPSKTTKKKKIKKAPLKKKTPAKKSTTKKITKKTVKKVTKKKKKPGRK